MKKIIFAISFLLIFFLEQPVYGTNTNEILKEQEDALSISGFIKEAQSYTEDNFSDIDISSVYKDAISGNMNFKRNI